MKKIETSGAPRAIGPYSQGYISNGFVFTSGQIAIDPVSGLIPDGIVAQTEQCCRNVEAILQAAGTSLTFVVKTTCFLTNMDNFQEFNQVYESYFTGKPARSCVAVRQLPKNVLCEIEVIAEIPT